jgi:uncharacterized surface protein with fasciclin (FAS1) repeats
MSILDTILNAQELKIFGTAIQFVNLGKTLHDRGPFTVFAPQNRAFTELSKINLQQLTADIPLLTKTVTAHIVLGSITYECLLKMCDRSNRTVTLKSINGSLLHIDLMDGIKIGNSTVVSTDLSAHNGIIYSIDRILVDPIPTVQKQISWIGKLISR